MSFRPRVLATLFCTLAGSISSATAPAQSSASAAPISSYDGEEATINSENNDLTDDGITYWGFEEGSGQPLLIDPNVKRSGVASLRFATTASTAPKDRMELITEINHGRYPALNHQLWRKDASLGFSVYFPADFPSPINWFIFHQIKQHDQKYMPSPNVAWEIKGDHFIILIRHGGRGYLPGTGKPDPATSVREVYRVPFATLKGRWTDFACRFKITEAADGYVEIFQKFSDETTYQSIVSYQGPLGYVADSATTDVQVHGGIYRGGQALAHVLWQDDVKIGVNLSDVAQPGATFAQPAKDKPTLVFKNGFEGDTRIVPSNVSKQGDNPQKENLVGSDQTSAPDDWEKDLAHGTSYFSGTVINYEQGDFSQRRAEIVPDPVYPAGGNKVLRMRIADQHIALTRGGKVAERKARIQLELYNRNPPPPEGYPKEYYQSCRLYFSPSFKVLQDLPPDERTGWFVMQEFWNDPSWPRLRPDGTEYPQSGARTGIELIRIGRKLHFGAKGRDPVMEVPAPGNNSWNVIHTDFAIPLGKWMKQEIYVKEGGSAGTANPGRFYMSITVDGKKIVIVDHIGATTSEAPGYVPDGQTSWNPFKIYMEGRVAQWLKAKNQPMDVCWDDLEIWQNRRP